MIEERRNAPESTEISADLISKGTAQLEAEMKIIKSWLSDLNETREDNPASIVARKSYNDMLQNRQELLNTLKEQQS